MVNGVDKELDLQEFIDFGYLQEANRQYFHVLGLALAVKFDDEGEPVGMLIYDAREDLEGVMFGEKPDREKAEQVFAEFTKRVVHRKRIMKGHPRQPLDMAIGRLEIDQYKKQIAPRNDVIGSDGSKK
jgi:hypothetical protein